MDTTTLRLAVDTDGCRIVDPPDLALEPLRRAARRDGDYALEVCEWIDRWAEQHQLIDALDDRGASLWWFVRPHMVFQFQELLPDIEALGAAAQLAECRAIRVDGMNAYWRRAAAIVARDRQLELVSDQPPGLERLKVVRDRLLTAAVLGARAAAAVRRRRHRPTSPRVAALVYPTCKRVTWDGQVYYLEPTFEPILRELERRGVTPFKLSAPSVNGWRHEWRWLRRGDATAIPIELSLLLWMSRPGKNAADPAYEELKIQMERLKPAFRRLPAEWHGYDVTPEVRAFVRRTLAPRIRRAMRDIRFFEHVFAESRPETLLVSDEYAGLAMAAIVAARRAGIPTVAVQHGVIWPGHPGYTVPKARIETMPKPDRLCVFGSYDRDLVLTHGPYAADEVVVTGSPRFDLVVNQPPRVTRSELANLLGVDESAPLVLFSSTGESHLLAAHLADRLAAAQSVLGIIVKLHPAQEQDPEAFQALTALAGPVRVRVVREEFDLYDLLRVVDVHMSTNSTVLSEAAAFDRPNIMLLTNVGVDTVRYVERGVAVRAEDYPSIGEAVEDVLHGPAADRLRAGRPAFVASHFHRIDGGSTARAADVVAQLLAERS